MGIHRAPLGFLLGVAIVLQCTNPARASVFNVRDFGAKGNGRTLDTVALNKAIDACAPSGGDQVLVPAGKYLTGTVRLKSNLTIQLDAGSEIIGTPDLDEYKNFKPPKGTLLPSDPHWHRALILGDGIENVTIAGHGVINGDNVTDAKGEEGVRGPHALLLGNSKNITLRDLSIRDAGNYAVLLEFTSQVSVRGVKITGGYDGVHFRGWKDNPCREVSIIDCEFYTGDDCIAGWYWQDALVDHCIINSSCNGIRLFGPAKHVVVHNCLFFGPGRYEWRTAGVLQHTNMAAGLCIQPSAWGATEGTVDEVHISDAVMHDVGTPLYLAAITPSTIGHVTIDRLTATGIYRAAVSIESWAKEPIRRVDLRDSTFQFVGGFGPFWTDPMEAAMAFMTAQSTDVRPPGTNARPLPAWGLYVRHVAALNLNNVRFEVEKEEARPAIIMDGVDSLDVDNLRWPLGTSRPVVLKNVLQLSQSGPALPIVEAECTSLTASPDGKTVTATIQGNQNGLAKIELKLDGKDFVRWTWLVHDEKTDVIFADLPSLDGQKPHEMVCGSVHGEVKSSP